MAAEKPETILQFSVLNDPTYLKFYAMRKEIPTAIPMFSMTDCRMAPKSTFCDVALNWKRKYAGRKNNMAATKPEVVISR